MPSESAPPDVSLSPPQAPRTTRRAIGRVAFRRCRLTNVELRRDRVVRQAPARPGEAEMVAVQAAMPRMTTRLWQPRYPGQVSADRRLCVPALRRVCHNAEIRESDYGPDVCQRNVRSRAIAGNVRQSAGCGPVARKCRTDRADGALLVTSTTCAEPLRGRVVGDGALAACARLADNSRNGAPGCETILEGTAAPPGRARRGLLHSWRLDTGASDRSAARRVRRITVHALRRRWIGRRAAGCAGACVGVRHHSLGHRAHARSA